MAFFKGAAKEAQRAMQLQRQREKDRRDLELAKLRLESEMRIGEIKNKFAAHSGASFADQSLGTATVGLVTLDEIKRQQERMKRMAAAAAEAADGLSAAKKSAVQPEVQHRGGTLSFEFADDVDDEEAAAEEDAEAEDNCPDKNHDEREVDKDQDQHVENKDQEQPDEDKDQEQPDEDNDLVEDDDKDPKKPAARRFGKDPGVDTWFLPDKDREAEERRLREELETEWLENQSRLKAEEMEVVFSYWDGSGHRRSVMVTKGMTIGQFLRRVLEQLRKEFQELRSVSEDQLMFIKEDTILPHHVAFIDLITSKARGKSGPLYLFDVKQDVRLTVDTALPSQETHAGKVCMRSWYDRNKHIFPACRWEPFDATKNWDLLPASLKTANVINVK